MNSSISVKSIVWNLLPPIIEACILWPLIILAIIKAPASIHFLWWVFFVFVGLVFPLVPLIEFLRCWRYDRHTILTYDKQKREVCYSREDVNEVFLVDDTKSCSLIRSRSYALMYYLEIKLESGRFICLTSLLKSVPDIEKDANPEHYREFFLKLPKSL